MGEEFILRCTSCYYENHLISSRKVSPVNNTASKSKAQERKIYDVNIWSLYSTLQTGVRLSGLKTICGDLDLPPTLNKTPFNKISKVIHKSKSVATEKLLKDAGNKLFNVVLENEPEKVDVNDDGTHDANVAVSVHGTWQLRGHTPKSRAVFVISILTEEAFGLRT